MSFSPVSAASVQSFGANLLSDVTVPTSTTMNISTWNEVVGDAAFSFDGTEITMSSGGTLQIGYHFISDVALTAEIQINTGGGYVVVSGTQMITSTNGTLSLGGVIISVDSGDKLKVVVNNASALFSSVIDDSSASFYAKLS